MNLDEHTGLVSVGYGGKLFTGNSRPCKDQKVLKDIDVIICVSDGLDCPPITNKTHNTYFITPDGFKKKGDETEFKLAVARVVKLLKEGKRVLVHDSNGYNQAPVVAAGVLTLLKAQKGYGIALYTVTKKNGVGDPNESLVESAYKVFEGMENKQEGKK